MTSRSTEIRAETPADVDAIAGVVERAFRSPAEARLVAAIRASDNYVPEWSLVAMRDGHVVGHVMVSYVELRNGDDVRRTASLSPLAVEPDLHGEGIGSALVRAVVECVDRAGEPVVVLEGNPRYYGRFGFEPASGSGISITLPDWAPPEAAQVMRLTNYDAAVRGLVVYPPAFTDVIAH